MKIYVVINRYLTPDRYLDHYFFEDFVLSNGSLWTRMPSYCSRASHVAFIIVVAVATTRNMLLLLTPVLRPGIIVLNNYFTVSSCTEPSVHHDINSVHSIV